MKSFKANCFEAYTNSDLTEGRGHSVPIGYFTNQNDATRAAAGRGVMGTDADTRAVNLEVNVFESFAEYQQQVAHRETNAALRKLSPNERKLLGLPDPK